MIAKTLTPEKGAKLFAIMGGKCARPGGELAGVASVPDGVLAAGGEAFPD
jgi:hypothetical protein